MTRGTDLFPRHFERTDNDALLQRGQPGPRDDPRSSVTRHDCDGDAFGTRRTELNTAGAELFGVRVVSPEGLEQLRANGVTHAFVGVGGIGVSSGRRGIFERLVTAGFELPAIIHASAIVSPWATLRRGVQVFAAAVVNADAEIGAGAIVNTGAIVEHDCRVGAHAHVAPGACLAGLASVGESAHVGIGAVVIEGVRIGPGALVGAGAVVIRDVPEGARVAGVPARPLG